MNFIVKYTNRKLFNIQSTVSTALSSQHNTLPPKRKPREIQHELMGTPLEDDCSIDGIDESLLNTILVDYRAWTDDEEAILPISLDESRYELIICI